jgi:hypothetical protein
VQAVRADLHVHTALSPCGGGEMSPPAIVAAALAAGLQMIGICDHNTAGNARAVSEAAGTHLTVICGMEIMTVEEVHLLGLFPSDTTASLAADEVCALLPETDDAYLRFFGEQQLMAADGTVYGRESRALAYPTSLRLEDAIELIRRFGGLAVAAHIDRLAFGVIAQLGFFPYDAGFDAVELSRHVVSGLAVAGYAEHRLPVLHASDSHYLDEVGCVATELRLAEPTFAELKLAVKGQQGRRVADA